MSKARDLADILASGSILSDGVISTTEIDGITATAAELNILDGVTSTTAELNILDGVTATTAELNYVDGVTSAIQTQLDGKETADATIVKDADIGSTVQAYDANLTSFVSTFTLPTSDGTADQVLKTNASGVLSFADAGGGGAWELFSSTTVTSSVSTIDISLSSSHDFYMVVVDNIAAGASSGYFRWERGGTLQTGSVYEYVEIQTSINRRTTQSNFKLCNTNTNDRNASGIIYLSNTNNSGKEGPAYFHQATVNQEILLVGGNNTSGADTGGVTGIRLYWDNNATSGSVYVYTLKKS